MIRFIKNKDLILRRIIDVEHKKGEDIIIANLVDGGRHAYIVEPFIDEKDISKTIEKLKPYEMCSLVVYNTKANFDAIVRHWDKIAGFKKNFSVNFINPFSKSEKRWVVYPMTHELVVEKSKIGSSLKILFSNVDAVSKEEIENILKEQ
ncbi:MAG: hypothetical protein NT001_00075 [Candidatus Woesearchaeota archaeon]|nr:hypothetical protein [Candidatus Woesearchaeota archaeon]